MQIKDQGTYILLDLEDDPTGSRLGCLINYPELEYNSCIFTSDSLHNAFILGLDILSKQISQHYISIGE